MPEKSFRKTAVYVHVNFPWFGMRFSIGSVLESLEIEFFLLRDVLARFLETSVSIGSVLESLEIEWLSIAG